MRDSTTDFFERGPSYAAAREILLRGCEYPPSLELFEHELKQARRAHPELKVEGLARRLSDAYHRVEGFFDGSV